MKTITRTVYACEFCGHEHEDKQWMELHEACCLSNPVNQPCGTCCNMLLGVGCAAGMNPEDIGGNVLCFRYSKGMPQLPLELFKGGPVND